MFAKGVKRLALECEHLNTVIQPFGDVESAVFYRQSHRKHDLAWTRPLATDGFIELAVGGAVNLDAMIPEVTHEDEAIRGDGHEWRIELADAVALPVAVARRQMEVE